MTLQNLPGVMYYPNIGPSQAGTLALQAMSTLDGAGEYDAFIFVAPEDMTISHVGVHVRTATGSPTMDVRIETVAADGMPSGTLWATNTNLVTGALSTGWAVHALTAAATVTKGQMVCMKIAYASGTTLIINSMGSGLFPGRALPYRVANTGTPAKASAGNAPCIVLGSGATTFYYIPFLTPALSIGGSTFNNSASIKRGARFRLPFKCRVIGLKNYDGAALGDLNVMILSDAGAELSSSSTSFDGDHTSGGNVPKEYYFDNPVTLDANTWYRAAIEPTSATNVSVSAIVTAAAAYLAAAPGGPDYFYTSFIAAAWVDTATETYPLIDLIIDQLDDGVGAGGGGLKLAGRGGLAG